MIFGKLRFAIFLDFLLLVITFVILSGLRVNGLSSDIVSIHYRQVLLQGRKWVVVVGHGILRNRDIDLLFWFVFSWGVALFFNVDSIFFVGKGSSHLPNLNFQISDAFLPGLTFGSFPLHKVLFQVFKIFFEFSVLIFVRQQSFLVKVDLNEKKATYSFNRLIDAFLIIIICV